MGKRVNPNIVKIHRNYTVEEVANLCSIHKNTVRAWVEKGLPVNDDKRPMLILGRELRSFLRVQKVKHKQRCKPHEFYCLRCKKPQRPAEDMVDYEPINGDRGCLIGICPACGGIINKYSSLANAEQLWSDADFAIPRTLERLKR
ncbi:MAG: helix-turn-helix domain-containing protein [Porticoccaceae bacterium]|nr:helix-turn-helix domain-containing protein [Porticoccaceae bacterium]